MKQLLVLFKFKKTRIALKFTMSKKAFTKHENKHKKYVIEDMNMNKSY